jgi:hypothetical protein
MCLTIGISENAIMSSGTPNSRRRPPGRLRMTQDQYGLLILDLMTFSLTTRRWFLSRAQGATR